MEFNFDVESVLPGKNSICTVSSSMCVSNLNDLDRASINAVKGSTDSFDFYPSNVEHLQKIIDCLGEASSKAQGLLSPITTTQKFQLSEQTLYIKKENSMCGKGLVVGILKVGRKRLFIVDESGELHEYVPLCVLDFYVHESKQRKGYGKELFQAMLIAESIEPQHVAIDRPSPKFVAFLQKHYNLKDIIKQANNFAVFKGFFQDNSSLALSSIPNQRHSYAGAEGYYSGPPVGRPHSLGGGVEGCFGWGNNFKVDKSPSCSSITSPSCGQAANQQLSSSWNVFGIPPPEYLRNSDQPIEAQKGKIQR